MIGLGGADLFNVTIAGNASNVDHSGSDGAGAGVSVAAGAPLNFSNSIIANNFHYTDGLFSVLNDCAGTINSQGYNIVTHPTCTVAGAFSTEAMQFGLLQYNGGPTRTLSLLAGSGGIDAGNPAGCSDDLGALDVDQRGLPRPVGAACDLGAYEVQDLIFQDGFDA